MTRSIGTILLCIYLVLVAIVLLTNIQVAAMSILMGVTALAAAIFLAIKR